MELEWDEEKNRANRRKHGLDFDDVRKLDWETATYVEDTRFNYPERRYWAFANWDKCLHIVAFCLRGAKVRVISFRKANRREIKRYGTKREAHSSG